MAEHYDPLYERSMQRSYPQLAAAPRIELHDGGPADLAAAASRLRALTLAAPADAT